MKFIPHDYQKECIDRIIRQPKVGLFLDMGLGKSVIALSALKVLKYDQLQVNRCLVIAPKKVAEGTWSAEADKWDHTKDLRVSLVLGSAEARRAALRKTADLYVINRENVVWLVKEAGKHWPFDMVVIDEASSFKNPSAKRFKALKRMLPEIGRMVLLTGTPSPQGIEDLWPQIYLLDQGERLGRTFTGFRNRYMEPDKYGPNGVIFKYRPKPFAEENVLKRIDDICVSMKAEDYLKLPDILYDDIPVRLDDKAKRAYQKMEREMVLSLPEEDITAASAAALTSKLLQLSNGAVYDETGAYHIVHDCKIDALSELIESLKERGEHALVFYSFKHDKERILKTLKADVKGIRIRTLDGPMDEYAWNDQKVDVLLAHPASCAYGLNLQQGGRHVVWFGLTWNYELYVQANARLYRQGQERPVIVHHLISEGTRDRDVKRALGEKDGAQQYVLNSLKARVKKIREER